MGNLEELLDRLVASKVEFVLVGGLAAALYGVSLVTKDVDVCIPITRENLERIEAELADLHPRHRMTTQDIPFVLDEGVEDRSAQQPQSICDSARTSPSGSS